MSIEAMKWAQKVAETGQLNTGQAFVLLLLGDHAGYSPLSVEPLLVGDPAASACLPDAGA